MIRPSPRPAPITLVVALVATIPACVLRAPLPEPQTPLAATSREALAGPPTERMEGPDLALRLGGRELDNGMRIVTARGEENGIASVVFISRGWPRHDAPGARITTEVAAAALFRRTALPDGTEMHDILEGEGYRPSVEALSDGLRISERVPAEEVVPYVEMLARSLRTPVFVDEDLTVSLAAQRERLAANQLTVDAQVDDRLAALLYEAGDPRAIGREAELQVLSGLDAAALRARHRSLMDPRACALVVTGDIDPSEVGTLASLFSDLPTPATPEVETPPPTYRRTGPRGLGMVEPLIRSYVLLRERAPPLGHRDHAAFRVLEQLLGGMFGAQLNLTLREEHTASYGFHAMYTADRQGGELELSTALDPRQTPAAVQMVVDEVRRMRGEGAPLTAFEIDLAKTRARELLMAELDTSLGLGRAIGHMLLAELDPGALTDVLRAIDALDAEAISAAARRWLRVDRAPIAVVAEDGVVGAVQNLGVGEWEIVRAPRRERR